MARDMAREEERRHGTPGACFTMDDVFADDAVTLTLTLTLTLTIP